MSHISQNKYGTVSWLPIEERYEWCINSIAFKYFNNQCINYLNEVFIKAPKSSLSLRNSYQKLQQPFHKTSTSENAFSFIDPTLWNKIPKETKRTIYINTFKHNLKKFYLKKIGKSNIWKKLSLFIWLVWLYFYIVINITIIIIAVITIVFIIVNATTVFTFLMLNTLSFVLI